VQSAGFLVHLLEAVEAVPAVAHHLPGLAHIAELLGQLEQTDLGSDDLLFLGHCRRLRSGCRRAGRGPNSGVRTAPRPPAPTSKTNNDCRIKFKLTHIIFKNTARFWARSSAGKYEPNVEELRRIFTEAPLLAEPLRAFRTERTARIASHETPVGLLDGGNLVPHVVPFTAFDFGQSLSLDKVEAQPLRFVPIGSVSPRDYQITFDGFLTGSDDEGISKPQRAYVQVFRSGAVEAVASSLARGEERIILPHIEGMII